MTRDHTPDDPAERANYTPTDASTADIEAALEERGDIALASQSSGCRRCDEKNEKRRIAGVDTADPTFDDGDEVRLTAVHMDDDDGLEPHWFETSIVHRHHPPLEFEKGISSGTDLVRAHARVTLGDEDRRPEIVDVVVVARSPRGEGPPESVVKQRQQEYVVEGDDAPDGSIVIELGTEDPPAHWPLEERRWLQELIDEHGPIAPVDIVHGGPL